MDYFSTDSRTPSAKVLGAIAELEALEQASINSPVELADAV